MTSNCAWLSLPTHGSGPAFGLIALDFAPPARNSPLRCAQRSRRQNQIAHLSLRRGLRQPLVAAPAMVKQVFHNKEHVFDAGSDALFRALRFRGDCVHSQHCSNPRRSTTLTKVVVLFDQRDRCQPRHRSIQACHKRLPTRRFTARRALNGSEACLLFHLDDCSTRNDAAILRRRD